MTSEKRRVLIVDDNADHIHVLMENLKPDYAVLAATSGEKALELAAKQPQPDVILLDVMMPNMDGYETCRRLKAEPETHGIDVIFVSAHDTTEEKLAGYDAGGCDYVIKPVQPSELERKVKLAIRSKDARADANAEKSVAMQTAMTAISSAGEQGVVLNFMRGSFTVSNVEELARLLVDATGQFGLENSVQIRGRQKVVNASTDEPMSPLEQDILRRMKDVGRLKEKGAHFVANFGAVTQLIKNMPEDDEKRGRLRDHLAILVEAAQARLRALEMNEHLAVAVAESNQALIDIQTMQKAQKEQAVQIMDGVMKDLEDLFLSCGLSDEQEARLVAVVQAGVDKSLDNFEQGLKIDEQLRAIVDRLRSFTVG